MFGCGSGGGPASTVPTDSVRSGDSGQIDAPQTSDQVAAIEQQLRSGLNAYPADTDFTLMLETTSGRQFVHSVGQSTVDTVYQSASTSKLVTAAVIMFFVEKGRLGLGDHPQDYIATWPTEGNLSKITLAELLNFTSGLVIEPACIHSAQFDFTDCVAIIAAANELSATPGASFKYNSTHMQVAGLMLVKALGYSGWDQVFAEFKNATGLFATSEYDLPSLSNPRLAGGMHWTAAEYMAFLRAIYERKVVSQATLDLWFQDYSIASELKDTPIVDGIGQEWRYGFGYWIECPSTVFNCETITVISSLGLFGAYPFVDFELGYFGILAREGAFGSGVAGYKLFDAQRAIIREWAQLF